MVRIYLYDIRDFPGFPDMNIDTAAGSMALISEARRERAGAYLRGPDKIRCLAAGLLLRRVCGITDDRQLTYGENGKPYIKGGGVYFNISHGGNYVVLAAADREVGVDVEQVAPYSQAIAARVFTQAEREWMRQKGEGCEGREGRGGRDEGAGCNEGAVHYECDEAFYRLWTAKESVMKAAGLGFALPPETFCVLSAIKGDALKIAGKSWFLDLMHHDGHIICSAIADRREKEYALSLITDLPGLRREVNMILPGLL